MDLYLMQHGLSLPEDLDPEEPLSPMGQEAVVRSAEAMRRLGLAFQVMVASPKLRAQQTAAIVARAVGFPESAVRVAEEVKAMARPETTMDFLRQFREARAVFVAGHLPNLSRLAALWLAERIDLPLRFENAGLSLLRVDEFLPGRAVLEWHLRPGHLARLA